MANERIKIPEKYAGGRILSFYQNSGGGIGIFRYELEQEDWYRKDMAECEENGGVIFAEFWGTNLDFERAAIRKLGDFDRKRKYLPGDVGLEEIIGGNKNG